MQGPARPIGTNIGFNVLPKDTCGQLEVGFEPPTLKSLDNLLYWPETNKKKCSWQDRSFQNIRGTTNPLRTADLHLPFHSSFLCVRPASACSFDSHHLKSLLLSGPDRRLPHRFSKTPGVTSDGTGYPVTDMVPPRVNDAWWITSGSWECVSRGHRRVNERAIRWADHINHRRSRCDGLCGGTQRTVAVTSAGDYNTVCWRPYPGCLVAGIHAQNVQNHCDPCERRE